MKLKKRIISLILILTVLLSNGFFSDNVLAETIESKTEDATIVEGEKDIVASGNDSFGNMFAKEINNKVDEQQENNGNNIFSVEMNGNVASVSYEVTQDATLVVGVYDESGDKMLASGYSDVVKNENIKQINIDIDKMPDFFDIKCYLVDTENKRPLCEVFDCPTYTRKMQQFLSKTVDDFDSDKVLNLDQDKKSNFAVYSDSTKVIPYIEGKNNIVSADDSTKTYIIENIDENISELCDGDTFAYNYDKGKNLIVKIYSIDIEGTRATIVGENTSMENVFEYVKIDTKSTDNDVRVNATSCEEGVEYCGSIEEIIDDELYGAQVDVSDKIERKLENFSLKKNLKKGSIEINGSIGIGLEAKVKFYLEKDDKYLEVSLGYEAKIDVSLTGKTDEEVACKLGELTISPIAGVYISLTPSFVLDFSGSISISGILSGKFGIRADEGGIQNISTKPQFNAGLKTEITVFVGLSMKPQIKILSEDVAKAELEGKMGVEISAINDSNRNNKDVEHECKMCIKGEMNGKLVLGASVKFVNSDKYTYSIKFSINKFISDFHYSFDFNEFNFEKCPHLRYLMTINVQEYKFNPVQNAKVILNGKDYYTDSDGKFSIYLTEGKYNATVQKDGYISQTSTVEVTKEEHYDYIIIKRKMIPTEAVSPFVTNGLTCGVITKDNDLYMWGLSEDGEAGSGVYGIDNTQSTPYKVIGNVNSFSIEGAAVGAVTNDGQLYMWGSNLYGKIGINPDEQSISLQPKKIMDNIKIFTRGEIVSCAITKSDDLYAWGGEIGYTPKKILSNIKEIENEGYVTDNTTIAVTNDGNLYTWGYNCYGQIGNGTKDNQKSPVKIMSNVKKAWIYGRTCAAIKKDGSLYLWGNNENGKIGNGNTNNVLTPIKIMDNVIDVCVGQYSTVVLKNNGDVYVWGRDDALQNGKSYKPQKIMENVISISGKWNHHGAIKSDGSLYMWGSNWFGEIGNGKTSHYGQKKPVKVLDNVDSICMDEDYSAAITKDGKLYMWGANDFNQVASGYNRYYALPRLVMSNVRTKADIITAYSDDTGIMANQPLYGADNKSLTIDNLLSNTIYNYYIMNDKESDTPFAKSNLLYIYQTKSDSKGCINLPQDLDIDYNNCDVFAVPMRQTDINEANVEVEKLSYNGQTQYVSAIVTLDDKILDAGTDYVLSGDYEVNEVGKYTLTIKGKGLYTGSKEVPFDVDDVMKGDINADGKIAMNDLIKCVQAVSGRITLSDHEVLAADVDGNGKVDIRDATKLLYYVSGRNTSL